MKVIYVFLCLLCWTVKGFYNITKLLQNYDRAIPPGYPDVTVVQYALRAPTIAQISEVKTNFRIVVTEYMSWVDPRLQYSLPSQTNYSYISLNPFMDSIWRPVTDFADRINRDPNESKLSRNMLLYPNGTITYVLRRSVAFICKFDFKNLPFDTHNCQIKLYVVNEDSKSVVVQLSEAYDTSLAMDTTRARTYDVESTKFSIEYSGFEVMSEFVIASQQQHSGIRFWIKFERQSNFFIIYYIFPSIMIIILSNTSFYINKEGVPGRVSLPVILILILLSLLKNINNDIPELSYSTWITNYILGIWVFILATAVEYGVLNYCSTSYNQRKALINKHIKKLSKTAKQDMILKERLKADVVSDSLDEFFTSNTEKSVKDRNEISSQYEEDKEDFKDFVNNHEQKESSSSSSLDSPENSQDLNIENRKKAENERAPNSILKNADQKQLSDFPQLMELAQQISHSEQNKQSMMSSISPDHFRINLHSPRQTKYNIAADPETNRKSNVNLLEEEKRMHPGNQEGDSSSPFGAQDSKSSEFLQNTAQTPFAPQKVEEKSPILNISQSVPVMESEIELESRKKVRTSNLDEDDDNQGKVQRAEALATSRPMMTEAKLVEEEKIHNEELLLQKKPSPIMEMIKKSSYKVVHSNDPQKYKKFINQLQELTNNKIDSHDQLDERSKKRIGKIIKIENQNSYKFCEFIANNLDFYCRFIYPLLYILYLVYMFVKLA